MHGRHAPVYCSPPQSPPGAGPLPSWIAPSRKASATKVHAVVPPTPEVHEKPEDDAPSHEPLEHATPRVEERLAFASQEPSAETVAELEALRGQVDALKAQLTGALDEAARARQAALFATERDLVRLALAIAEQVLGREVRTSPAIVARWALEGLAALDEADDATVAIAPDVAALVPASAWEREPVVDPALPPGGCEIRARFGRVDASLTARLAAIAEGLLDP